MSSSVSISQRPSHRPSIMDGLGLNRPDLRAWAMYDWAVSALQTTIMVAIFPIFFVKVAAANLPSPLPVAPWHSAHIFV